jgi:hypothetical protein
VETEVKNFESASTFASTFANYARARVVFRPLFIGYNQHNAYINTVFIELFKQ